MGTNLNLKTIAQSNGALGPNDVYVLQMDMLDINHHNDYFNMVIDHFKSLDILVNNAGRSQRAAWNAINVKVDRELFELDVFAVVHLSRIALNFFVRNSIKGHLAVTSSTAGLIGAPNSASYTGAKHALHVSCWHTAVCVLLIGDKKKRLKKLCAA